MIERYALPRMSALWGEEKRFSTWLKVELLVCEAMAAEGLIPRDAVERIKNRARIDVPRIKEIEKRVKHEVIAFLSAVTETVGDDGRYLHLGVTSSDIMDTSTAVLLREAADVVIADLERLLGVLKEKAWTFKDTVMIGRSHGVHAEPITFGLKMALWYEEAKRNTERVKKARDGISVGKISGAVGTFAHLSPGVEEYVCRHLGLAPDPISNQIIQRDRHAFYLATLALTASSLEKWATEIRHLQRTEVLEVEEPFTEGQMGSSSMPHKRNPVGCENICGLARLVRGFLLSALEDIPLWHERDISHSSVERIILPDSTSLVDFMLTRFTEIMEGLSVYPDTMKKNLDRTRGAIHSERLLLELVKRGVPREKAYESLQKSTLRAWRGEGDFVTLMKEDTIVSSRLSPQEIERACDTDYYLRHIDVIFKRVFS